MQPCETMSQRTVACHTRGVQSIFGLQLAQHLRAGLQDTLCMCDKHMADFELGVLSNDFDECAVHSMAGIRVHGASPLCSALSWC